LSVPEIAQSASRARRRWPVTRWIALLAVLLAEGMGLGVAFDSATVATLPAGWWTPLLRLTGSVMPAAAALLGALLLVAWARPRWLRGAEPPERDVPSRYIPYLALHATGFLVVLALTAVLFGEGAPARSEPGRLVAAWLFAVVVTLGAWLGAMAPPRYLIGLARTRVGLLVGALVLGLFAFGIGRLTRGLWMPLRKLTFGMASGLLGSVAKGAFADPATLTFGTSAFAVEIAPQCSGYEGVGLTWAFLIGALWLFRDRFRFPRAFLLLAFGAVLPLVANVGRLVALVLVGSYVSPEIAAGGFHSYAGSILFCAVALGIVAGGLRSPWMSRPAPDGDRDGGGAGAAAGAPSGTSSAPSPSPYLVPFLAMTAAGLLSRAFSSTHAEPLQLLRPAAGVAALALSARAYREMSWRVSWTAVPAGLAVAAAWLVLGKLLPGGGAHEGAPAAGAGLLAARAATAVLLVPLVEELAFRGFLARRVMSANFEEVPATQLTFPAVAVSAAAFGVLHQRPVLGVVAGLCYAWLYRRRGQLADAVVAHAVTNLALVAAAWLTGHWELWK
jgi:exosortase E/protease (VPEID-CTERM system)